MPNILTDVFTLAWDEADSNVRKNLAITVCLVILGTVLATLSPIALKLVIDGFTTGDWTILLKNFEYVPGSDAGTLVLGPTLLIVAYASSEWASRSVDEVRWKYFGAADARLNRRLSRRLFTHILHLPLRFHLDRKSGALNQTLVQGTTGYRIILQHAIFSILPVILELMVIGTVLVFLGPVFLLILALSVILYSIAFTFIAKQISQPSSAVSSTQINAHAVLTDSVLNYETIKYFSAEGAVQDRYDSALGQSERRWKLFFTHKMWGGLLIAVIFALSLGASTFVAASHVMQSALTIGDFVLINAYMLRIIRPLEQLGFALRDVAQGAAFIEKMMEILQQEPEASQLPGQAEINLPFERKPGHSGEIVFKHVNFSYRPGRPTLKNITFSVPPGKTLAIVGPSGSGKSSLIRLLMQFYRQDSGDILLNGIPIQKIPLSDLRQSIAVVPQDTVLFNDTIAYNVGFGKSGCSQQEIQRAAELAHIHDFVTGLAKQYRSLVGERGLKLSGGEKQRVSIARAILKQPQVFVFDEATSSLDTKTEREILRNLIEISKGTTTILIAHRLSTVVHADEILVLDRGEIIEHGCHRVLLQKNGRYAGMWHTQQGEHLDESISAI